MYSLTILIVFHIKNSEYMIQKLLERSTMATDKNNNKIDELKLELFLENQDV